MKISKKTLLSFGLIFCYEIGFGSYGGHYGMSQRNKELLQAAHALKAEATDKGWLLNGKIYTPEEIVVIWQERNSKESALTLMAQIKTIHQENNKAAQGLFKLNLKDQTKDDIETTLYKLQETLQAEQALAKALAL